MNETFSWPIPPHFVLPSGEADNNIQETCLLVDNEGQKILGILTRFAPEQGIVQFLPNKETAVRNVQLNDIKSLRLVRPLYFKHQELNAPGEIFQGSEKQKFTVNFKDKEQLAGETKGFSVKKEGLYLFIVIEHDRAIRCFIPHQSMIDYQIGDPIGKILVDEKIVSEKDIQLGLEKQQQLRTQRIGEYLTTHQIVAPEQLAQALKLQKAKPNLKLGEALIQEKLITPQHLSDALAKQQQDRKLALGEILVEMGAIDKEAIRITLAKKLGIPFVNLKKFNIDPNVIKLVPETIVRKHAVMPLCRSDLALIVALENPMSWEPIQELRFYTKMNIEPVMAEREDILTAINHFYGGMENIKLEELAAESALMVDDEPTEIVSESENTVVRLVNKTILDAYQQGVSDIHIESYPGKKDTRIRFRKDGTLVHYFNLPANFRTAFVSRIKIMSQLDISEKRKPQDGKIDFQNFGPAKIELRVATVPTANGLEDVVMRILAAAKPLPLDNIGLSSFNLNHLKKIITRPYGLFLICGPTGSGKTTTLHSVLSYINTPEQKIWTAEDPIEITQEGLRQVQVSSKTGWTFAAAMRSFLRADPDVIMVGEMRDAETTKIGIEASLTGHLVFSTLHTNSAPESIIRLLDLGMDPFNFADALLGVLAQRLTKRLCVKCKEAYFPTDAELQDLAQEYCLNTPLEQNKIMQDWLEKYKNNEGKIVIYQAKGCDDCDDTGYRGRLGLHEVLIGEPEIKRLIQTHAPVTEIFKAAILTGMRTLKQDGIEKILQGHTDIKQIRAVAG